MIAEIPLFILGLKVNRSDRKRIRIPPFHPYVADLPLPPIRTEIYFFIHYEYGYRMERPTCGPVPVLEQYILGLQGESEQVFSMLHRRPH